MHQLELVSCTVDLIRGVVVRRGGEGTDVVLTTRESDLLRYLAARPSRTIRRHTLLTEVWGYADHVLSRACDGTIRRLRAKVEQEPSSPHHLLTVHGEGYRFEPLRGGDAPVADPVEPLDEESIRLGSRRVDLARHEVVGLQGTVTLSAQEVTLLRRLRDARGAVVERAELGRAVWGVRTTRERALVNAVSRLRAKLEPDRDAPRYLLTERGAGYRLRLDDRPRPTVADAAGAWVGRTEEQAWLVEALAPGSWVLVVGTGGIGKTRLVRRVVSASRSVVWWVDLAGTADRLGALVAVSRGVGVQGAPLTTVAGVAKHLARLGPGILVLDNLEQLADEVAELLPQWRSAAPSLTVVGTSRVRLGLDGERVLELSPLSVADACALFVHRARAATYRYRGGDDEVHVLEDLVDRLGCLPLAVELAAARRGVLTASQLLDRMHEALDLLVRPRATAVRHRSLRAVFDDTVSLLTASEQSAWWCLSLLAGPFDLVDAEGVVGSHAVNVLQALRDHGLVHTDVDPSALRFGVLELMREHAEEARRALPDQGREAVLDYVRWMARLGRPEFWWSVADDDRLEDRARLRRQLQDCRAAARRASEIEEPELAAWCVVAATKAAPNVDEGMLALGTTLLASGELTDRAAGWLAMRMADLQGNLGVDDRGMELLRRAVRHARRAEDGLCEGRALEARALRHHYRADFRAASRSYLQAADAFRRGGADDWALHVQARGWLNEERHADAYEAFAASLALPAVRRCRHKRARVLRILSIYDYQAGRLHSALQRAEEAWSVQLAGGEDRPILVAAQVYQLCLLFLGDHATLERVTQVSMDRANAVVFIDYAPVLWANLAISRRLRGDLEAADDSLNRAREVAQAVAEQGLVLGTVAIAAMEIAVARRDWSGALRAADEALTHLGSTLDRSTQALCDAVRALCLAQTDQPDGAASLASATAEALRTTFAIHHARGTAILGQVAVRLGDEEGARRYLLEAEEVALRAESESPVSWAGQAVVQLRSELERSSA
ncbi:MAG: winged helix-turn-helix domain-containing protein [Myxococcales bacterium]|nr:winged helix-turn-helix domain-containing protein [Myxococcales bacterium]